MKKCKNGHVFLDDTLMFCTRCGEPLEPVTDAGNQDELVVDNKDVNKPIKKKGCFKKIIIILAVVVVCLVAGYSYLINAATYLRLEPNELHASKGGGDCTIEVDYDGYVWSINHEPNWVSTTDAGDVIRLSVRPNTTGEVREGSITVQSGKQLAQIVIRQNAVATSIKASETAVKFSKKGGIKYVTVETDGNEWTVKYPDWLNVSCDEDKMHVKCPSNSDYYRSGQIIVTEDNVMCSIFVSQGGKCPDCNGKGEVLCTGCYGMGGTGFGFYYTTCFFCGGRGSITCGSCKGTGYKE